jgi:thymidine phosphorylase
MCALLGGPSDFLDNTAKYLATAPVILPIYTNGTLSSVDGRALGNALIELGGGRQRLGEEIDSSVGFSQVAPIGTLLDGERPLAVIHASSDDAAERAGERLLGACETRAEAPPATPVIIEIVTEAA